MDDADRVDRCPRCGAEWLADTPEGLCPACLLAGATGPSSEMTGDEMTTLSPRGARRAHPSLNRGSCRARCSARIASVACSVAAGMGEVYEAERVEQGRELFHRP